MLINDVSISTELDGLGRPIYQIKLALITKNSNEATQLMDLGRHSGSVSVIPKNEDFCPRYDVKSSDPLAISNIDYNAEEGITVVVFKDGTIIKKQTAKGDNFDLNVGIALAIAEKHYGSKNKYHNEVDRLKTMIDDKHAKKLAAKEKKEKLAREKAEAEAKAEEDAKAAKTKAKKTKANSFTNAKSTKFALAPTPEVDLADFTKTLCAMLGVSDKDMRDVVDNLTKLSEALSGDIE